MALKKIYFRIIIYCFAIVAQAVLTWRAFGVLFSEPEKYLLQSGYDGLKNYFIFLSYLNRPAPEGIWLYKGMHYPFGEYIFYTDLTPLLAVFLKLFSRYIVDVTPYNLQIYHFVFIIGIVISTILLIAILSHLLHSKILILICSLALPWINPQTNRLLVGHANLSLSFVLLFAV